MAMKKTLKQSCPQCGEATFEERGEYVHPKRCACPPPPGPADPPVRYHRSEVVIEGSSPSSSCSRLPELRERFPKIRGIKYEPDPSCRECRGSGVSPAKTLKSGTRIGDGPCACVFLGEHTREIKTALAGVARKTLGENSPDHPPAVGCGEGSNETKP